MASRRFDGHPGPALAVVADVPRLRGVAVGEARSSPGAAKAVVEVDQAVLQGGREDEGLERRAGVAALAHGQVELRRRLGAEVVAPADHGQHVAVGGVDGDERGLGVGGGIGQHLGDGGLGRLPGARGRWWCGCVMPPANRSSRRSW